MSEGDIMSDRFYTDAELVPYAFGVSSPIQKEQLRKMVKMGWQITRVIGNQHSGKFAIGAVMKNTPAWLLPDGSLKRPKVGEKTVDVDMKLLQNFH